MQVTEEMMARPDFQAIPARKESASPMHCQVYPALLARRAIRASEETLDLVDSMECLAIGVPMACQDYQATQER